MLLAIMVHKTKVDVADDDYDDDELWGVRWKEKGKQTKVGNCVIGKFFFRLLFAENNGIN